MQAIAYGQDMWRIENKSAIEAHQKGNAPDPSLGIYWLSQAEGESLPTPEQ